MVMVNGEEEDTYTLYDYCTGIDEHVDETIYKIDRDLRKKIHPYEQLLRDRLENIKNTLTGKRLKNALHRHSERVEYYEKHIKGR